MNEVHIFCKRDRIEVVELPGDRLSPETLSVTIYGRGTAAVDVAVFPDDPSRSPCQRLSVPRTTLSEGVQTEYLSNGDVRHWVLAED